MRTKESRRAGVIGTKLVGVRGEQGRFNNSEKGGGEITQRERKSDKGSAWEEIEVEQGGT